VSEPHLDWSEAEVKNGRLTVSLAGDPPRGWNDTFERTAQLLGHGEWGDLKLKKHSVRAEGVRPGSEERLRHFLESVVLQANATHEVSESESPEDPDESEDRSDEGEHDDSADAEMTERFRSFT
jgi:hypothetical protein